MLKIGQEKTLPFNLLLCFLAFQNCLPIMLIFNINYADNYADYGDKISHYLTTIHF